MFVVFTSTVEVRISAVYMGGVALAEHDSMPPCIANTAAGNVIIGGTNRLKIKTFYHKCSLIEPAYIIFKQITSCCNTCKHYDKIWL